MKPNGHKFMPGVVLAGFLTVLVAATPASLEAQRAVRRGADSGGQTSSGGGGGQDRGGSASPRSGGERRAAPPRAAAPAPESRAPRGDAAAPAGSNAEASVQSDSTPSARRRGSDQRTGVAVARRTPPPSGGGTIIVPGGWYPWGWGGYGFAGYYGFYDPWGYGGYGYRGRYGYGYGYGGQYYSTRRDEGSVRLKVKPRDAEVYVDGYYAGVVDNFDGVFQSLPLDVGPHRIEVQLDGHAPLTFDVRVLSGRKITFEGELQPAP